MKLRRNVSNMNKCFKTQGRTLQGETQGGTQGETQEETQGGPREDLAFPDPLYYIL